MVNMNKKTIIKAIIIAVIVAALLLFNRQFIRISPEEIRNWILSFGWLAPIFFIVLYTLRPIILFPASIVSLAGGLAFGAAFGTIYTIIGATGGAVLSFIIARKLGKNLAKKEWTGKASKIQEQLEERGFYYILVLRFIPIFNFDMISYLAGISKVRFKAFFLGTLFGIIPGTFAYSFLGASIVVGDMMTIMIAIIVFIVILLVPLMLSKKYKGNLEASEDKKL
jgi:uncharacterized membrane protein YdjX (TVP38/TMEM64 family)